MADCTQCGAELGVGRFCINCGHPVGAPVDPQGAHDWRTGTAERPAVTVDPTVPPPVHETLPPPRYPLFAGDPAPVEQTHVDHPAYTTGSHRAVTAQRRPGLLPWLVGAVVLLVFAGLGAFLLFGGDEEPTAASDPATAEPSPTEESPSPSDDPTTDEPSPTEDPSPTADGEAADVARFATAIVPATAPPSEDGAGNAVRYEARNMLDGVPETTWRMPGDGTGETLTFELDSPTTLSAVGLINGYAKTATEGGATLDWYAGNRRILAVEWLFDDGTLVRQDLTETRDLQTVGIDQVTTETVQVRLVTVSAPGDGPSSRNYTAVSEVSLVGVTAG